MENIHPMTVHFTIALFSMAVLFELLGWLLKNETLRNAGWWNHLFAVPGAIVSVLTGRIAASTAPHNDVIHEIIERHETYGYIVLGLIIVLFIVRLTAGGRYARKVPVLVSIVGIIALGLMFIGAWFGGELVFTHGMGVKPMMKIMAQQKHDHGSHNNSSNDHEPHDH